MSGLARSGKAEQRLAGKLAKYDTIGIGYNRYRVPDPRIAALIEAELKGCRRVLNIGAGVGSYEPDDLDVVALEPSAQMIQQRPLTSAPVVQGVAEALPFADNAFDAAMGVLTLHHWRDQAQGLREALRVGSGKLVLLSFVGHSKNFWLFDYFPEIEQHDRAIFPALEWMERVTESRAYTRVVPIPADCSDGFLCAYWRRPQAYLDAGVRRAISSFAVLEGVEERLQQLRADLDSGDWQRRHGHLMTEQVMDFGYRIVVLESG